MLSNESGLLPPAKLAIAYCPAQYREEFELILQFDARLAGIVATASEPIIGQMKIAWWRDAITAGPESRPKGEPLLATLATMDTAHLVPALLMLLDAWEMLLVNEQWSGDVLSRFGQSRGMAIFETYQSRTNEAGDLTSIASDWALADLAQRSGNERVRLPDAIYQDLPKHRVLRPLTVLAMSVRDVSGVRMLWHALTGY
jgi:15-cis-phytoene synthase